MFVEINEIKGFIINVDGFLRVNDETPLRKHLVWSEVNDANLSQVRILPEFNQLIIKILLTYSFTVVSRLSESHLKAILKNNSVTVADDLIFTAPETDLGRTILFDNIIAKARDSIKLPSCKCVYITAEHETMDKALRLHLGTVLYKYKTVDPIEETEDCKCGPDFILDSPEDLDRIISKEVVGYLGEYNACPARMKGAVAKTGTIYLQFLTIPHENMPNSREIFVTGRYFPTADCRFAKHPLSIRLLNSKNAPEKHLPLFAKIIKDSAEQVSGGKYDYITCVPAKPSQQKNRAKMYLEHIPVLDPSFDKSKIKPDILRCVREHEPQKLHHGYADRKRNIGGAYAVAQDVTGKTVIVVDDITTTGATLVEHTEILLNAGCANVYPIAIGFTPSNQFKNGKEELPCPACGGHFVQRTNSKTGEVFWGCSGYIANGCRQQMRFEEGVKALNELTSKPQAEISLEDIDIPF